MQQILGLSLGPRLIGPWAHSVGTVRVLAALRLGQRTADPLLLGTSRALLARCRVLAQVSYVVGYLLGFLLLASGIALVTVARRAPST